MTFLTDLESDCFRCYQERCERVKADGINLMRRMFLCRTCGNKRCPKATDHTLECTGSNEPGQAGSIYT